MARVPLPLLTLKLIALPTTALLELLTSSSLEQLVTVPTMAAKTAIEKINFFIVFRIKINKYVNKKGVILAIPPPLPPSHQR